MQMNRRNAGNGGRDEAPIVLYTTPDGAVKVNVYFRDGNLWLPQAGIAELFGVQKAAVSKHLKNIFAEGELDESAVVSKMETTAADGKKYSVAYYGIKAIIAVGYRVNSERATAFRIWATDTLEEFVRKGFVLNDEMLKNGKPFGQDYFDELLERIREIRASERRAYQKIADLFEQCSCDYSPTSELTQRFYAFIQNKLHYAVAGNTAAGIIYTRADANKPTMGLTTWKGGPGKKILRSDTHIAKNYLNQKEMQKLDRLVVMFIDWAEMRALDHKLMTMREWADTVDKFLGYSDQQILRHAGEISHDAAIRRANEQYDIFRVRQDREYLSEFDRAFEKYLKGE